MQYIYMGFPSVLSLKETKQCHIEFCLTTALTESGQLTVEMYRTSKKIKKKIFGGGNFTEIEYPKTDAAIRPKGHF